MTAALILDFDGVCTPSAHELVTNADNGGQARSGTVAGVIRPEAVSAMSAAQSAGLCTVILSNELDRGWLDGSDLASVTDEMVVGADNGIYKPDRRAFQRCLLATGVAAERAVLVDDHPDNVAVADTLGFLTVLFDTTSSTSRADCWADVHRLIDTLADKCEGDGDDTH